MWICTIFVGHPAEPISLLYISGEHGRLPRKSCARWGLYICVRDQLSQQISDARLRSRLCLSGQPPCSLRQILPIPQNQSLPRIHPACRAIRYRALRPSADLRGTCTLNVARAGNVRQIENTQRNCNLCFGDTATIKCASPGMTTAPARPGDNRPGRLGCEYNCYPCCD